MSEIEKDKEKRDAPKFIDKIKFTNTEALDSVKFSSPSHIIYDNYKGVIVDLDHTKKNYKIGVVNVVDDEFLIGWFEQVPSKNIAFLVYGTYKIFNAISKDIFKEDNIIWDNKAGRYIFTTDPIKHYSIEFRNKYLFGAKLYPYTFDQKYSANDYLTAFTKTSIGRKAVIKPDSLIPYTYGIEYETSGGAIPQDICYDLGLIPLRDGSIRGNEYASVVLSHKHFSFIPEQCKALKKYTIFDKDCSLHIHLGGFPLREDYLLIVYHLCILMQCDIVKYLPEWAFSSEKYKSNKKNYCMPFPQTFSTFEQLYKYLTCSTATVYNGSLYSPHPMDKEGKSKWNIPTRYFWVNFINAIFYNKNKTIEFRILRPTYNYHKIINWIYIFSAILKYAEQLESEFYGDSKTISPSCKKGDIISYIEQNYFNDHFEGIFNKVYPEEVATKLSNFLDVSSVVVSYQSEVGDYCGNITGLEDEMIIGNAADI